MEGKERQFVEKSGQDHQHGNDGHRLASEERQPFCDDIKMG